MTGPGFSVDPSGLASVAPQYSDLADRLNETLGTLRSTLDGLGDYWGGDQAGEQYAKSYLENRDQTLKYHADLVTAFTSTGNAVVGWADGYANAEQDLFDSM